MNAVKSRSGGLTRILLSCEDVILHLQNKKGDTALHIAMDRLTWPASIFEDETVDRLFLQQHVSEHFEIPNSLGLTPLSLALTRRSAEMKLTTQEWRSILTSRRLKNAVDALSNHRFGLRTSAADEICEVVRNLTFFSSFVPITAPHMAFSVYQDPSEVIERIERTVGGLRIDSQSWLRAQLRYCELHKTPASLHLNDSALIGSLEITICLVS